MSDNVFNPLSCTVPPVAPIDPLPAISCHLPEPELVPIHDCFDPAVLSLSPNRPETGPQGPHGAQGARGLQGGEGPRGYAGANGADGGTGAQGPRGSTGAQGDPSTETGPRGYGCYYPYTPPYFLPDALCQTLAAGDEGPTGPTGPDGPPGYDNPDPGPKGPTGDAGPKTAIVPCRAADGSTRYIQLCCAELPEVWFEDIVRYDIIEQRQRCQVDERFIDVCEPDTIRVSGVVCAEPVFVGAKYADKHVDILLDRAPDCKLTLTVRLSGLRRGFTERFKEHTYKQMLVNNRFWMQANK